MTVSLRLHTVPEVPMEADQISPQHLVGLSQAEIEKVPMMHGNRPVKIADFFHVQGTGAASIRVEGSLERIKHIGAQMNGGEIIIDGNAGAHLGAGMRGGQITVLGNAEDWVAPELSGGRVVIHGNAGHMVGSAYRGSPRGMIGGEIVVHGSVRNELGHGMRNGLIAVGGDCGDFPAVNMLAGTIVIFGQAGIRAGAGMKRGTLVCMNEVKMLPTFSFACTYRPGYLGLYLRHLQSGGLDIPQEFIAGSYDRWCGDSVELSRGEILVFNK